MVSPTRCTTHAPIGLQARQILRMRPVTGTLHDRLFGSGGTEPECVTGRYPWRASSIATVRARRSLKRLVVIHTARDIRVAHDVDDGIRRQALHVRRDLRQFRASRRPNVFAA